MGSTSAEHSNTEGVGRRDLIKRSAALGLISVPTMSFLSACASSDSGSGDKAKAGKKTTKNPLGVNETAPLSVVIFDGGFGTKYATDANAQYKAAYPKVKVNFHATQKIQSELQPKFNGGTPPDLIDNSGAQQMDMGVLVGKKQLTDLTPLLDAPSIDDPSKKVRDTLRPGIVEMGQFDGDPVWIMYYAYTVYGVWYSQTALDKLDATYPEDWDAMLALCEKAKKKGIAGWTYAGKYPYYLPFSLSPSSPRSAAVRFSTRSTTWSPTPGRTRPSRPRSRPTTSSTRRATSSRAPRASTTSSRRPPGPRARPSSSRTVPGWRTSPRT